MNFRTPHILESLRRSIFSFGDFSAGEPINSKRSPPNAGEKSASSRARGGSFVFLASGAWGTSARSSRTQCAATFAWVQRSLRALQSGSGGNEESAIGKRMLRLVLSSECHDKRLKERTTLMASAVGRKDERPVPRLVSRTLRQSSSIENLKTLRNLSFFGTKSQAAM